MCVLFAAAAVIAAVVGRAAAVSVAAGGGELGRGEGNSAEHFAGILGAAGGVAAFLGGNGVIQHRHDELGIPLQTDHRELAQGDKQPAAVTGFHQIFVKLAADTAGDLDAGILPAPVLADFPHLGAEDHGIQHLHHSGGQIGAVAGGAVSIAQPGIAAENVGLALFPAEHRPLGEYRKAVQRRRPCGADGGVSKDPVVECHIDAVVAAVEGHRLHGGLLRLENFRRRFHHFRHHPRRYHRLRFRLQS